MSIEAAVRARDAERALGILFERQGSTPVLRIGWGKESRLWDFKAGLPKPSKVMALAWAEIAADVAAFHNGDGGLICFGIEDKTLRFVGTRDIVDAKQFNDQLRRYLGDKLWVEFSREYIQPDQRYLGVALVPPRGILPLHMRCDAPERPDGTRCFSSGDLCVRANDETRVLKAKEIAAYLAEHRLPSSTSRYHVDEPGARILRPDWHDFLVREEECKRVLTALGDERTYVTSLTGVGGIGKTALACWAVLEKYGKRAFDYYISISAKDRELTPGGIAALKPGLSSFDDLLNQILLVLGFSDSCGKPVEERETEVRALLTDTKALLFVDNLETVDDRRVVAFLETLPKPVKAITTSRTATVRTAAFPVPVGPLTESEAIRFLEGHARRRGRDSINSASSAEKSRIIAACDRVPLVIEWLVGKSKTLVDAMELADALGGSGKRDQELLEFCFRRVHSGLLDSSKEILSALSLHDTTMVLEAIGAAVDRPLDVVEDALQELESCSLVERVWDDRMRDFASRILPLTRRFAYRDLRAIRGRESEMRDRLSRWYQAKDVVDAELRPHIVAARRGDRDPDVALVDAAIHYRQVERYAEAERYFQQAIERNPKSWRAHREYGELLRDGGDLGAAIECYTKAAANAPKRGTDRAIIFREAGMVWRKSGRPDAYAHALRLFQEAQKETPHDPILKHGLADAFFKLGQYRRAEPLLEELIQSKDPKTRARTYDMLEKCYAVSGERLKLLTLQDGRSKDQAAAGAETTSSRLRAIRSGASRGGPGGNRRKKRRRRDW